MSQTYSELCCKTKYSFLTGASSPDEIIKRAAELKYNAIAVTDLNGVYGMPKAYRAIKALTSIGSAPKLIVGTELTLTAAPPLTLVAKTRAAYGTLCRIITAAHADKPKGEATLTIAELSGFVTLAGFDELVAIFKEVPTSEVLLAAQSIFRRQQLHLALARHFDGHDQARTQQFLQASRELAIPLIATNDVLFHAPERKRVHDVVTAIKNHSTLAQIGSAIEQNSERYLKSPEQMTVLFSDLPGAVAAANLIADQCVFSPAELRYRYPSEWIPSKYTAMSYLRELTTKGAQTRYASGIPIDVQAQLDHELALIEELNFADYFLTIWEIVEFAKQRDILCQGRGSAANSVVCYCLGITAIDPVKMNLLFERFISVERGEPPDIDVDFEHERREEVIQHIYSKYGRDRAGMVAAVICYRDRASKREVFKTLEVEAYPERLQIAEALAGELYGTPRHLSIHSGGFTLSADPIIETVPIEPARMEARTIVQWDKDDLDAIGLLKVDILALGMLSAIQKACKATGLTLYNIPHEDRATYQMICKADTVGVFQIESRAQMNMLGRLQPKTFYDLVIEVAIVRPGPIVGKMVHPYLRRRRGLESIELPHQALGPILKKTLGVPLFQEQVMKMSIALAGFTPGEADELRRSMGTWRSNGRLEEIGIRLKTGFLRSGLTEEFVDRIFEQIKGFAEYGFPESHAASFALLAYASSYLKCHHPTEFTWALVNSQPLGFYSNHTLIDDAKRHGVEVRPLDINVSEWDCTLEPSLSSKSGNAIRLGFRIVNGIARVEAEQIIRERAIRPFSSLADFLGRCRLRSDVLHRLALGDLFAPFGFSQRQALWAILEQDVQTKPEPTGQLSLFSYNAQDTTVRSMFLSPLTEFGAIQSEYHAQGLSLRGHPMQVLREVQKELPQFTTRQIRESPHGRSVKIAGLTIVRQRPYTAKGAVFATLEDETGFLDLTLPLATYQKYREVFLLSPFVVVRGMLQRDRNSTSILVRRVEPIYFADSLFENSSRKMRIPVNQGPSIQNAAAALRQAQAVQPHHPSPHKALS